MQGKEASEQETKAKSNMGIDVSKCWLDVHVLPTDERRRVANSCAGIRQLKRWLLRHPRFISTSRLPALPGSTWWNAGSRASPKNNCAAASIAAPANCRTPSATTSNSTTVIQNPSSGPKPLTKSSNQLLDFVNVLQTQDTSG